MNALLGYPAAFFGIWWAWMNVTWFASSFDTDDWADRLLTFLQMGGVLVFAAGIHDFVADRQLTLAVAGYVIIRLAMVSQWLRAARDLDYRAVARGYAYGIVVVQVLWLLALLVPKQLRRLVLREVRATFTVRRRCNTCTEPIHDDCNGCDCEVRPVRGERTCPRCTLPRPPAAFPGGGKFCEECA